MRFEAVFDPVGVVQHATLQVGLTAVKLEVPSAGDGHRGKLPIAGRYRLADDCVETASQVSVAINLLEEVGAEVCGLTVPCALRTEETRSLDAEYGVYLVNPWDED